MRENITKCFDIFSNVTQLHIWSTFDARQAGLSHPHALRHLYLGEPSCFAILLETDRNDLLKGALSVGRSLSCQELLDVGFNHLHGYLIHYRAPKF